METLYSLDKTPSAESSLVQYPNKKAAT